MDKNAMREMSKLVDLMNFVESLGKLVPEQQEALEVGGGCDGCENCTCGEEQEIEDRKPTAVEVLKGCSAVRFNRSPNFDITVDNPAEIYQVGPNAYAVITDDGRFKEFNDVTSLSVSYDIEVGEDIRFAKGEA